MAELRKQARSIENQLDAKLVQYSRLDTGSGGTSSALGGRETPAQLQRDIEQMLSQLGEVNDKMSRGMGEGGGLAASMHVLQRHRIAQSCAPTCPMGACRRREWLFRWT